MHIDYKHRIVSGPAGVGVRVGQYTADGQVPMRVIQNPTAGNGACWWADGVLFNAAEGRLSSCWPDGTGTGPVSPNAATSFGVIGTEWAAFLADGHTGVYTSWGLLLPASRLTGTGPALYTVPQSGRGLTCYSQGGFAPAWELPTAAPLDFYAVNVNAVLWTEGDRRIHTEGLPPIAQTEPIYNPSAFFCAGTWWLLHARGTGGAIVRPFDDPTHGFIVADGNAFGLTLSVPIDSFSTLFAWSTDAGETVVWARTIDLSTPLQDLTPPVVVLPIAPFTHPVQVAAFKDPTGATGQPAIETFGVIVETLPPPSPLPTVRRIWIRDNDTLPYVPEGWRQGEWALVEFYRRKTETLSQSVVRWSTDLARTLRLWPYDVGVIPQLYCQGGVPPDELWTVQEVLDGLAYLSALVNLDPRIKVVAPFCYDRVNGMIAHPELLAAFYRIVAASPGAPVFTPLPGPIPTPTPPHPTPTPLPTPTPTPVPPQESHVYSDLHVEQITPLLGPYTEAPHPDQQGLVLVQNIAKENFTVDPWGGTRWSTDAGSWQRMYPSGGGWFAYREDTKRLYFVTRVPKLPYMD